MNGIYDPNKELKKKPVQTQTGLEIKPAYEPVKAPNLVKPEAPKVPTVTQAAQPAVVGNTAQPKPSQDPFAPVAQRNKTYGQSAGAAAPKQTKPNLFQGNSFMPSLEYLDSRPDPTPLGQAVARGVQTVAAVENGGQPIAAAPAAAPVATAAPASAAQPMNYADEYKARYGVDLNTVDNPMERLWEDYKSRYGNPQSAAQNAALVNAEVAAKQEQALNSQYNAARNSVFDERYFKAAQEANLDRLAKKYLEFQMRNSGMDQLGVSQDVMLQAQNNHANRLSNIQSEADKEHERIWQSYQDAARDLYGNTMNADVQNKAAIELETKNKQAQNFNDFQTYRQQLLEEGVPLNEVYNKLKERYDNTDFGEYKQQADDIVNPYKLTAEAQKYNGTRFNLYKSDETGKFVEDESMPVMLVGNVEHIDNEDFLADLKVSGRNNPNSKQSKYVQQIIADAKEGKIHVGQMVEMNYGARSTKNTRYVYMGNGMFMKAADNEVYPKFGNDKKKYRYLPAGYEWTSSGEVDEAR